MRISLGFSPCPNDTFLFDALVHGRIDTEGLTFDVRLADVEELNRLAFAGELDVTKLSYHALGHLRDRYALLHAGSALGRGCGPLLIARESLTREQVERGRIAIPGKYTTANFLLSLAYPEIRDKREMLFSDIEGAVLAGAVDAGLIIHENRFTYQDKGLVKIIDLGEYWETETGHPIPLGGIVVNRRLDPAVQARIDSVLRRSVAYAFDHPNAALPYVKAHAQEMEEAIMYAHIDLYVNDYSLDLGTEGRAAVAQLYAKAEKLGLLSPSELPLLVDRRGEAR